ncbi:putative leader peptide [Nocardioides phosphati]
MWTVWLEGPFPRPSVCPMFTTMLTERRAVDLLRVASSLCRMS